MSQSKVLANPVVIACEWCGVTREVAYENRARRFCAKPSTCCYDYLKRPKAVLTDEQRAANEIRRAHASAESRRGTKRTPEQRERISSALRDGYASGRLTPTSNSHKPEVKAKISSGLVRAYVEGRADITGQYKNKHTLFTSPSRTIKMRSRSEALFAHHLDSLGVEWSYEPQRFDLGWATYTPDFHLPEFDHWVEVKGWWTETSRRKFDEFATQHSASAVMAKPLLKGLAPTITQIMKGVE